MGRNNKLLHRRSWKTGLTPEQRAYERAQLQANAQALAAEAVRQSQLRVAENAAKAAAKNKAAFARESERYQAETFGNTPDKPTNAAPMPVNAPPVIAPQFEKIFGRVFRYEGHYYADSTLTQDITADVESYISTRGLSFRRKLHQIPVECLDVPALPRLAQSGFKYHVDESTGLWVLDENQVLPYANAER
jgi:hypothetical protein